MINLLLAIVVSASIDSTMLMLGDQTDLYLSVTHEASEQVQMPVYGEMLQEGIEIVDRSAIDTTALPDGRVQMTQDLTLTSFKDSLFAIQPLYVTSGEDTFWTEPMALNVIQPFEVDSSLAITDIKDIEKVTYDHPIKVSSEIIEKIKGADLIILSPGSLYTSIIPHLITPQIKEALAECKAPIMYISNLVTQPGETDDYTVGDHIKVLNRYLGERKVDVVIANNEAVTNDITETYNREKKTLVKLDEEEVMNQGADILVDEIIDIDENGSIRHDELKTAYLVFSWLMG